MAESLQSVERDEAQRAEATRASRVQRVILIAAAALALDLAAYVISYLQVRQGDVLVQTRGVVDLTLKGRALAEMSGLLLTMVLLFVSWLLVRRRRFDLAGYVLMGSVFFAYAFGEMVWRDKTALNLIGGVLLVLAAGNLVLPRKWWAWVLGILFYVSGILLVNWLSPFRTQSAYLSGGRGALIVDILVTLLAVVIFFWMVARAFRVGTIRARLLISFFIVVAVPLAITLGLSVWAGRRAGQERAIAQLESVVTLKEAVINTWLSTLEEDVRAVGTDDQVLRAVRRLVHEQPGTDIYAYLHDSLQNRMADQVRRTGRFHEMFLLDLEGNVIVSTDASREGKSYRGYTFFQLGLREPRHHLTWEWAEWWMDTVRPVTDGEGRVIAVLTGRAGMRDLNAIMLESTGLGQTGETYLVSHRWAIITPLRSGERVAYVPHEGEYGDTTYAELVAARADGSGLYSNYVGKTVVGAWHWIRGLEVALIAEQEQREAYSAIYAMLAVNVGGGLLAALFAVLVSFLFARSIAAPLADLADTAAQIAGGDLSRVAHVEREDEVGALAHAFNAMTARLRGMLGTLERQVEERTMDLAQRSRQLEAAAYVAREAAAIRDVNVLLDETVRLISEQFGFYHAGIFLIDEAGEYAVLQAASSEGGQRMLARGHKLKVGQVGIVGYVAGRGEPRIALDVGEDAVFFDNPDLPETRSEMGLPLRVRGRVIGVLDVQSREPAAFSAEDIAVLETLADQVALAIENARLLEESRRALTELETLYGRRALEGWADRLGRRTLAYRYSGIEVEELSPVEGEVRVEEGGDGVLRMPILLRNQPLGTILLRKEGGAAGWTPEEVALVRELGVQIGLALENARLLEETQRRAEQERLAGEIVSRIRETLDVEAVLRVAAREIGEALNLHDVTIRLDTDPLA